VVATESGSPLSYAVVELPDLRREQFTDSSGAFQFSDVPAGSTRLRVKRLGYSPMEITLHVRDGATDTVRVALSRIALTLAALDVQALPPCVKPGPPRPEADSVLAAVFTQLLFNAEQFRLLSESYPFSYLLTATAMSRGKGETFDWVESVDTVRIHSNRTWRYRAGEVLQRSNRGGRYGVPVFRIPTLQHIASPEFLKNHCFHYRGLVQQDSTPLVRIDVVAAERLNRPDVNGEIFLDPESFQIQRTVLRLSRLPDIVGLLDTEVTTDFREMLPSIPVVSRVRATHLYDVSNKHVAISQASEDQRLSDFTFLRAKPGDRKP
jgi:hypothetical protein